MIKLKPSTITLILINVSLFILLLIAQCTKKIKYDPKEYIVRLVPPSILKETKTIVLSSNKKNTLPVNSSFKIIKKEKTYILKKGRHEYYIKIDLIERLFKELVRERKAYFITNNFSDYIYYGISEDESFSFRFIGKNEEILLDLYIGFPDSTEYLRYIRRGSIASSVIAVEDNISTFLTSSPLFWLDMQIYKAKFMNDNILEINMKNEVAIRNKQNDLFFKMLEKTLSSLTMINIFDGLPIENDKTKTFTIKLEKGSDLSISLTPLENEDYILFDNTGKGSYIISSYSTKKLIEKIENIFSY